MGFGFGFGFLVQSFSEDGTPRPKESGFRGQKPFRVWMLGPKTLLFGYLDPLGSEALHPKP